MYHTRWSAYYMYIIHLTRVECLVLVHHVEHLGRLSFVIFFSKNKIPCNHVITSYAGFLLLV